MPAFPRHSIAWRFEERTLLQRVTQSLPAYGLGIGVVARLFRWAALALWAPVGWPAVLGTIIVGLVIIAGLATGHFANYSVRSWRWRAPALAAFIALGESATSLLLIILGKELGGRALMTIADWPGAAINILLTRELAVCAYAAVLAIVVITLRDRIKGAEDVMATNPDVESGDDA
jgi:hypothetical protein